jgi:hypothetical protein
MEVGLDRAFAHLQFACNHLIWMTRTDESHNLSFAICQTTQPLDGAFIWFGLHSGHRTKVAPFKLGAIFAAGTLKKRNL